MTAYVYYLNPGLASGSNDGSSSANAWQSWAACVTALNSSHSDLTTGGDTVTVNVEGGDVSYNHTVDLAITVVSTSTYYLKFLATDYVPATWDSAKPMLTYYPTNSTNEQLFRFGTSSDSTSRWVIFEGMQFYFDATSAVSSVMSMFRNTNARASGSGVQFKNCYFRAADYPGNSALRAIIYCSSSYLYPYLENCILENVTRSGSQPFYVIYNARNEGAVGELYNCTFINNTDFIYAGSGNIRVLNCLFNSASSTLAAGTVASGSGKNASTAASGLPGSDNTYDLSTTMFVSSTDRHLTAANGYGAGTGVATYGAYVPATDIDGDARGASTTDVGADLYVAAATGAKGRMLLMGVG